jgi:hypothetical protein
MRGIASKWVAGAGFTAIMGVMLPVLASSQAPPRCGAKLVVRETNKPGACWLDERVTKHVGTLQHSCGDGPASATFGTDRFEGAVKAGHLSVGLETEFVFGDHCKWKSTQRIEGTLESTELVYTYSEAPLPGQKGCASACTATGSVLVH